jgi:hypothetical protein
MKEIAAGHDQAIRSVAGTYADQRDRDAQLGAFETEYKEQTNNMFEQWFGRTLGIAAQPPSQNPSAPPGPKAAGSAPSAAPPRPPKVPSNYVWDSNTRHWNPPKKAK